MSKPVNVFDYEALARPKLPQMTYDYFAGGSNDEVTLRDNREAFDRIKLLPYSLRDVSGCSTQTTILGKQYDQPFLIAPMGFMGLAHPECENAVARAAGAAGVGVVLSTMSSVTLESVAQNAASPLWFQLYVYKNRDITRRLVERAEAAGYEALVLTVDTPILGRREKDIRNQWHLPPHVTVANLVDAGMGDISAKIGESGLASYIASLWDASISWEDVVWLKSITRLPLILKGILRADDALKAAESGVAGIIVSNHGGRQVDTTPAAMTILPQITEAVGDKIEVFMDGGIRRGTDIIKALAYGAKGVMVGRPILWGLAYSGEAGVRDILEILKIELATSLALCGCHNIDEVSLDLLGVY